MMRVDNLKKQAGEGPIAGRLYPKVIEHFKNLPDGKLLDVGTGKGNLANRLYNMGFDVSACDILSKIKKKGIKYKKVDLNKGKLPYKAASFDYVTCTEVIEHLENPRTIIHEISRVLKPGGILVITTPNITSLPQRIYFLFTGNFLHFDWPSTEYGHISPISKGMIKDSFDKLRIRIVDISYDRGWIPLLRLTLPSSHMFGDLMIIKATKKEKK